MSKLGSKLYLLLILFLLVLPCIGLVMNAQPFENCEKREMVSLSVKNSTVSFFENFESYCKDRGAFRNVLTHISSTLKLKIFNSSPQQQQVIRGKNNWYYYTKASDGIIKSYAHTDLYLESELESKTKGWQLRAESLRARDVIYQVAIWPNKPTIYPENLPYQFKIQQHDTLSKLDQILQAMKDTPHEVLDVREDMKSKKSSQLYFKNDSHWNDLGAYYAYQALMRKLGIAPFELSDFEITWQTSYSGDLIDLMGLCNSQLLKDKIPILKFKGNNKVNKITPPNGDLSYYSCDSPTSEQTLLMFRDSYSSALRPFLSLHFKASYYPWSYYDETLVNKLNPDYVVSANVERRI